jgi:hypothetical protein
MSDKEKITCQDCNAEFEIKYNSEEYSIYFCPMCASELFLEEDEEDEEDKHEEWIDPDNDEYE